MGEGGGLFLLISKWHWVQKPKFQLFGWGREVVFSFWSASDTESKKNQVSTLDGGYLHLLISKWHWFQKPKFQIYGWGVVSAFCSASDTDFEKLSPNFRCDGVSTLAETTFCIFVEVPTSWSACDTDFKNLSSNFLDGGGRWSFPFDQQVTLSPK